MLHESALGLLQGVPIKTVLLPLWLSRGKANLKQQLAKEYDFEPSQLPYNTGLIEWLSAERQRGRRLILCTATNESIAQSISNHLAIFDEVIASNGTTNLAGANKARVLVERFGKSGFDYAGNSDADLPVWSQARRAIVVNASSRLLAKARALSQVELVLPKKALTFGILRRTLRIHQWLKNLLLFVPFLAAHEISNPQSWTSLCIAFLAFSLCASSVYIANDLLDLPSDRHHPRKRHRPFASGDVPIWAGVIIAPLLFGLSVGLASLVNTAFMGWLLVYFALTCVYSFLLKKMMLIDCLTLTMLYTMRIVAGAAAVNNPLSFWLLAFSIFLFLSLAFVKRYAEMQMQIGQNNVKVSGRGYLTSDAPIIQMLGISAGYLSVLVLALYLNSSAVLALYQLPESIWAAVPILLFWVSWMWMQAHRGLMNDDPLVFAVKDKSSLVAGALFVLVLAVGSVGL